MVLESMVVIRFTYEGVAAGIVFVGAVLTALGYLIRLGRKLIRYVVALHNTVERELNHNHGTSIKDDTYGTAVIVGTLQRDVTFLYRHLGIERPADELDPA